MKHYHDSEVGGAHLGRFKTYEKLSRKYFWLNMSTDVAKWVKTCPTCNAIKHPKRFIKLPMGHLPIPTRPFQTVHTDCIGPLRLTKNKKKYICVFICPLSKFVEAFAVTNVQSTTIATVFTHETLCRYSMPEVLFSDNGTTYTADLMKQLCSNLGIKKTHN